MRKFTLALPLLALATAQPAWAVGLAGGTSISTGGSVIASPTGGDISQATSLDFILTDGTNTPSPGVRAS